MGVRRIFLSLGSVVLIVASALLASFVWAGPALESVDDQVWNIDGCIDDNGIAHVVHSTQEGLIFADLLSGAIENPRKVSSENSDEAAMVYTKDGMFLIAYIVEKDFFNTALKTMVFDGKDVIHDTTLLEGSSYHNPALAYFGNTLFLTFEQGGSAEGSVAFSNDITMMTSQDNGATWAPPQVLFNSIKDETLPSLAAFGGRLYISFVQVQDEKYSKQGNAFEAEDRAVMVSSHSTSGSWTEPYRVSYDIAEVISPTLVNYGHKLVLVWGTNKDKDGMKNMRSISCMLYDGAIWSDQVLVTTDKRTDLVPLLIAYTARLVSDGKVVPGHLSEFDGLEVTERDPDISLSDQTWDIASDTYNQVFRKNLTVRNRGNSLLSGYIEVPKSTDNIMVSASTYRFDIDPGDEMMIVLQVELDHPGEYDLTVFIRSNDADNRIMPYFINIKVRGPIQDFFSTLPDDGIPDGNETPPDGNVTPPDGNETPPDGNVTPPDGNETPPDDDDDPDANVTEDDDTSWTGRMVLLAIITTVFILILIIAVVLVVRSRSRKEKDKGTEAEMAIFFVLLLIAAGLVPLVGSAQEASDEKRLIDEVMSDFARSRVNISESFALGSSVALITRSDPVPEEAFSVYTVVTQAFDVEDRMVDGIYFWAQNTKTGAVPLDMTVKDIATQRVLGRSRTHVEGPMKEYLTTFNNSERIKAVSVEFSTRSVITPQGPSIVRLGCIPNTGANMSEVLVYAQENVPSQTKIAGRTVLRERFNFETVALGARFLDPQIFVMDLTLDKKAVLLDRTGDSVNGSMTLFNNLARAVPIRVRIVCYGPDGKEHNVANQFIDLSPKNRSSVLTFSIDNGFGLKEGKHVIVIGLYYLDGLIFRFGDDQFEMYSSAFIVSHRRIEEVSVLPTDRVRPGGQLKLGILKIDGVPREVDDTQVEDIKAKLRAVSEEYAFSYEVTDIRTLDRFEEIMAERTEDLALINTHGSVLPIPDRYVSEFTGSKDTVLLLHFNEYRERPVDSSDLGNIIENYPRSVKPDNAFWVPYDQDGPSLKGKMVPLFVNGLVDLPARPVGKTEHMTTGLKFNIDLKVMDLPEEGDFSQIASFWNRTELEVRVFSMRLWNRRGGNDTVELEIGLQNGLGIESTYFTLPYKKGFNIGEWTTLDCTVDRTDKASTIVLEVIDRLGRTAMYDIAALDIGPEVDSNGIDSLIIANDESDESVSWSPSPLEAVIGTFEYHLFTPTGTLDKDSWDLSVDSPRFTLTSYFGRTGMIYCSLHISHGAYKPQFVNSYTFRGSQWLEVINNDKQKLSEFTIEMMLRTDQDPAEGRRWTLVSKSNKEIMTGYFLELEGGHTYNRLRFGIGDGEKLYTLEIGGPGHPAISLGDWHKVCAMYDGTDLFLQIDGQEVGTLRSGATVVYDPSPIRIGGYGPEDGLVGSMDELIISKGCDSTDHNIKYAQWLGTISEWISSSHSVWVNPTGYPLGYLGFANVLPIYYGDCLFKQLLAPLTNTPGEFLNTGKGAVRTPQGVALDSEFSSLELPASIDYDLSCSASREGAVIPLYYDTSADRIPAGAVKFGEGAYAFSTVFSPDITLALAMMRLPNDYILNILNSEHYKGEDILVRTLLVNPTGGIETYFVNLTVSDPFGREYLAHSKNVTILPGREAEVHLLFQPKRSIYPKGTYRMFVSVERENDGLVVDLWGDDNDESKDLVVNLIDDIELEVLDHAREMSHNGTLRVPVRVINHGALPSYVNIEMSILSPGGSVFEVTLPDRIMVASHRSRVVEMEWDPARTVEDQARKDLVVDIPFGDYKVLVAMYDAESVLYTSNIVAQKTKETGTRVFSSDDMEHMLGAKRESNGWSIEPQRPPVPGYLCKGLTTNDLEDGDHIAGFELMINENTGRNEKVANLSVWFGSTVVAYREVYKNDFINPNSFQSFNVEFSSAGRKGQSLSFRTHWEANCYLKQAKVEVVPYRTTERVEDIELRTKPIDFEYTGFSMMAETRITAYLMKEDDHYVSAELFYDVGDQKGSFDIPKTDQCYSFTLYHYPKDTIFLTTKGLGGGKDLKLSAVRTTETFIIQKKGSKLIDVKHGYSGDVVDITLRESTSDLMIKDTLTLEDLSVNNYTKGVTAGFDDEFARPYVQFNSSEDWAEFEVDIPASKAQRLTIEAFEEPGKEIVLKCLINTTKAELVVTFAFLGGTGTWTQNSTNVQLASGHYTFRVSQQRDTYHARMYPEVFVTALKVFDHGETAKPKIKDAGNSISVCVLGLGFNVDLSFIPKIPDIPIPGIEVPKLSIGDTLQLSVVDVNRTDVEELKINGTYYLRIRIEYTHESKDSKKDMNGTHKSGLKYNWKKANDRPGIESLTFIVGVELRFSYKEHEGSGIRYPSIDSFGIYELGVKIKIRLKAWSNPGTFILDICTGGSGSLTPGVSELFNVIFGALRAVGFDIGAGLYLMIEATLIFKPYFKLIFNIYPLGELWAKIVLDFWFFKFTLIDLMISLVLPIGIEVVADSAYSPWRVFITFWIKLGGKLVLFQIKIFEGSLRIDLFTIYISKGTPRSRSQDLITG